MRLCRTPVAAVLAALAVMLLTAGCSVLRWTAGGGVTRVDAALPEDFPEKGFSHAAFESLLRRHVSPEGLVDYAAWHASEQDRAQLDSYLAAVAAYSPDNAPERFPADASRMVYWVHAYNAFVIKAVLDRWPLGSVTDVSAPIELTRGFGFFYGLDFVAGGRRVNLYDLEHEKLIRDDVDARVHFILNCGSQGCPVIRPELPTGPELELVLAEAAREFVADPANVRVDAAAREVHVSPIFDWYEDDFLSDLRRRGVPADRGILDYVISISPDDRRPALEEAASAGFDVVYGDYDWGLNAAGHVP